MVKINQQYSILSCMNPLNIFSIIFTYIDNYRKKKKFKMTHWFELRRYFVCGRSYLCQRNNPFFFSLIIRFILREIDSKRKTNTISCFVLWRKWRFPFLQGVLAPGFFFIQLDVSSSSLLRFPPCPPSSFCVLITYWVFIVNYLSGNNF